jgi:uncharacterized protein (DUF885 family)
MPPATIDTISDDYVERLAALDPVSATMDGVGGHEHELTDYSPAGAERRAQLARRCVSDLDALHPHTDRDLRARRAMQERLRAALALHDTGEHLRDVSTLFSPLHQVRMCFDLMATSDTDDWTAVADRMDQVAWSLGTYREALLAGLVRRHAGRRLLHRAGTGRGRSARSGVPPRGGG